jgi:cell division initiation protein
MRDKKFGSSFLGYKKQDVYEFIEKLAKDLEEQIKIKDNEILKLKTHNEELKNTLDELSDKFSGIENDRSRIADAIIKAEQKANSIVEEAIKEAEDKKIQLQGEVEVEAEKVEEVKKELRTLRETAINVISNFERQLFDIAGSEEYEEESIPEETELSEEQAEGEEQE